MGDLTHGFQWSSLKDSGIGGCASHIGCTKVLSRYARMI
jgi:hypothetical protein